MPARPHLARVLVRKRIVRDVAEAFDRYLREGKPVYAPRPRPETGAVAEAIARAGGLSIVAHPGVTRLDWIDLLNLKSAGLDGVEVHHSDHSSSDVDKYERWAKRGELLVSGGSDFHGAGHAGRVGLGRAGLSREAFEALEAAATARRG
jgi:predicted metal-dependent phosphoesterase TrpH